MAAGILSPMASSMGRLFDAAAAACGVRHGSRYEGQAAMELESLAADHASLPIPLPCTRVGDQWVIDPLPLLDTLAERRMAGRGPEHLAADFHDAVSTASATLALQLCSAEGLDTVALGGGSFQNVRLLTGITRQCRAAGLRVLLAREIPVNDGGIAYGQCVVASARFQST
jgi:hydrogenase maturation protein HypF